MAQCSGTTKTGKPCKANALTDRDVCMAHADEETRKSANFQQGPRPGRPPKPKAIDIYREKIEAERDRWFQVLEDARAAERGVVVGDGPTAHVELIEDHPTRLKAFKEAHDRVFGKATQFHDVTTREEESEVDREIRELLSEMDRLPSSNGKTPASNGNGNGHVR